jgi:hypothetical protein
MPQLFAGQRMRIEFQVLDDVSFCYFGQNPILFS